MTGLLLPGASGDNESARDVVELAAAAERAGFGSVWVGDHLQWMTPFLDPIALLAAISTSTERVGIGASVLLAPLRHPVPLAKSLLTIDRLSEGRLTVGLGSGTTRGGDYASVSADPGRRREAMDASVPALRGLLGGDSVELGQYWRGSARLEPGPHDGRVPIYLGGHSDAALHRTAREADGWIASFVGPERLETRIGELKQATEAAGRKPEDVRVMVIVYTCVASSVGQAVKNAEPYFKRMYGMPAERAASRSAFGPPEVVADRLMSFRDAGADDVILAHPGFAALPLDTFAEACAPNEGEHGVTQRPRS